MQGSSIYHPLASSEVRLVYINRSAQGATDRIQCTLKHAKLADKPKYFALSYVWGNTKNTLAIQLNDSHDFHVTQNLHDALSHLRDRTWGREEDRHVPFWIDAICINQGDISERSEQVPRMTMIYSSATQVIAWLGPPAQAREEFPPDFRRNDYMEQLFKKLQDRRSCFLLVAQMNAQEVGELPANLKYYIAQNSSADPVWDAETRVQCQLAITILIKSQYFQRIWIVQEVALATMDPLLVQGKYAVQFSNLYFVAISLGKCPSNLAGPRFLDAGHLYARATEKLTRIEKLRTAEKSSGNDVMSGKLESSVVLSAFAHRLYNLLTSVGGDMQATDVRDRIYGLLGLARLPTDNRTLFPDYSKSVELVFQEYATFLISETGNADIIAASPNDISGAPSWISDFSASLPIQAPKTKFSGFFFCEGTKLALEGRVIGSCIVSHDPDVWVDDDEVENDPCEVVERLRPVVYEFHLKVLDKAARILDQSSVTGSTTRRFVSQAARRAMESGWIPGGSDFSLESSSFEMYKMLLADKPNWDKMLQRLGKNSSEKTDATMTRLYTHFARLVKGVLCAKYFVLNDGTIGCALRGRYAVKEGDLACVFKGTSSPLIIRKFEKEFRVVRSTDGILWPGSEPVFDESFFSMHETRPFTLI